MPEAMPPAFKSFRKAEKKSMNGIKKGFIVTGAAIGGVLGGALSTAGRIAGSKMVDELGEAVIDSAILTGAIAGQLTSGAADLASGKITKSEARCERGRYDLKAGGKKIIGNWKENLNMIFDNSSEIIKGVRSRDSERIVSSIKTLGKMAAVGAITVGTIKVEVPAGQDDGSQRRQDETKEAKPHDIEKISQK